MHTAVDIDGVQQEISRDRNCSLLAENIAAGGWTAVASDVTGGGD